MSDLPKDAREYRRRTGIDVDNHHNALTCPYCNPDGRMVLIEAAHLRTLQGDTRTALDESVKLQAHYAALLNMHDGGQRRIFASADEWIARLREIGTIA